MPEKKAQNEIVVFVKTKIIIEHNTILQCSQSKMGTANGLVTELVHPHAQSVWRFKGERVLAAGLIAYYNYFSKKKKKKKNHSFIIILNPTTSTSSLIGKRINCSG